MVSLVVLLSTRSSFGFIVLENELGKKTVLAIHEGKVVAQPCGAQTITLAELKNETGESLLARCRQESLQSPPLPHSPSEGDYIYSAQSLYGVRGSENAPDALVKLTNKVLLEEPNSEEETNDRASKAQLHVLNTLRLAHKGLISHLGSDSHRIVTWEEDRGLYFLALEALRPVYFDSKRFWMMSDPIAADKIDTACPVGWAPASVDLILNSRYFIDVTRWFTKTTNHVLTWYRWQTNYPIDGKAGYVSNQWNVVLVLNQIAVEWDLGKEELIPRSGMSQEPSSSLPGIGSFVYSAGAQDKHLRRCLCTRTFVLAETSERPPEGQVETKLLASRWGASVPQLARLVSSVPEIESKVSQHAYWVSPLSSEVAEAATQEANLQLGLGLPQYAQVKKEFHVSARSEIQRLQAEIQGAEKSAADADMYAGPYDRSPGQAPNASRASLESWARAGAAHHARADALRQSAGQKSTRIQTLQQLMQVHGGR